MRALWIENKAVGLRDDIQPIAMDGGVEVNVSLAGICGTDLELLRGYYGFAGVPGHEFVGRVASGDRKGQRVVADINFGCGKCARCARGHSHHCVDRRVLGIRATTGAFAERVIVPACNLVPVPDQVPDWQAAQTEPLAAAMHILDQVGLTNKRVLLVGAGRLGRMVIRVIQSLVPSASLHVCVREPERAAGFLAANYIAPDEVPQADFDVAIDCTGHPEGFKLALEAVRPEGTLVVKSTYADQLTLDMSSIVVNEISVVGSRCGNLQAAMDSLATGAIQLPDVGLSHYDLSDFTAAFEGAKDKQTEKVFFRF